MSDGTFPARGGADPAPRRRPPRGARPRRAPRRRGGGALPLLLVRVPPRPAADRLLSGQRRGRHPGAPQPVRRGDPLAAQPRPRHRRRRRRARGRDRHPSRPRRGGARAGRRDDRARPRPLAGGRCLAGGRDGEPRAARPRSRDEVLAGLAAAERGPRRRRRARPPDPSRRPRGPRRRPSLRRLDPRGIRHLPLPVVRAPRARPASRRPGSRAARGRRSRPRGARAPLSRAPDARRPPRSRDAEPLAEDGDGADRHASSPSASGTPRRRRRESGSPATRR